MKQCHQQTKPTISDAGLFVTSRANGAIGSSIGILPCANALIFIDWYELVSVIIYHCPVLMPRATPRPLSAVVVLCFEHTKR
jgi:hypothetical protein